MFGVADMRVKERLLREAGLTLAKPLDICLVAEASKVQMRVMATENQQSHDVNSPRKNKSVNTGKSYRQGSKPPEGSTVTHKQHTQSHQGSNCGYCGSQQQPRKCPAYGVLCSKCHGMNHFAKVCRGGKYTKKVYQVETELVDNNDDSSNYLFVGTVTDCKHSTRSEQNWQAVINVQGKSVLCKLDTGSEANVLPINVLKEIKSTKLEKSTTLLCAFGDHKIVALGTVTLDCPTDKGDTEQLLFFVTDSPMSRYLVIRHVTNLTL